MLFPPPSLSFVRRLPSPSIRRRRCRWAASRCGCVTPLLGVQQPNPAAIRPTSDEAFSHANTTQACTRVHIMREGTARIVSSSTAVAVLVLAAGDAPPVSPAERSGGSRKAFKGPPSRLPDRRDQRVRHATATQPPPFDHLHVADFLSLPVVSSSA